MRRYAPLLAHTLLMALSEGTDPADNSHQDNALTSPKLQTYIEKDPIGSSKQLRAPRSAVACRLSLL